jgi:hypothetical protein
MVDGIFFLRDNAREEPVYFSPISMTYNIEKKAFFLLTLTTKKNLKEERNKLCTSASVFNDEYMTKKENAKKKINHA